jgi:hypothetical protein
MTPSQVTAIMGKPPHDVQFVNNKLEWKYYLQGGVPYYLVFGENQKLESWYEDEQEYQQQQQANLAALQSITDSMKTLTPATPLPAPVAPLPTPITSQPQTVNVYVHTPQQQRPTATPLPDTSNTSEPDAENVAR